MIVWMRRIVVFLVSMLILAMPGASFAESTIDFTKPILFSFEEKVDMVKRYELLKFENEQKQEIPVLLQEIDENQILAVPLFDLQGIKVKIKTELKNYKTSVWNQAITIGDETNLKKMLEAIPMDQRAINYGIREMDVVQASAEVKSEPSVSMDKKSNINFSQTNNQVQGVDEADIIKTDGQYIYYLKDNQIIIVKAEQGKMTVQSRIQIQEGSLYPQDMYLDKDKLVLIGTQNYKDKIYTQAIIYAIEDKTKPVFERMVEQEGYYVSSRKSGSLLYLVSSAYLYQQEEYQMVPMYKDSLKSPEYKKVDLGKTMFFPRYPSSSLLLIGSLDIQKKDDFEMISAVGEADNIYMSDKNLYMIYREYPFLPIYWERPVLMEEGVKKVKLESSEKESEASHFMQPTSYEEKTIIKKFTIQGTKVTYQAENNILGNVINQFSMDEYQGNFRVAYTKESYSSKQGSSIAIFDKDMKKIGAIDGIAPGEKIYSARFMGERSYLVTFRTIDPFFVMDLKDPANPKMLGYLKVPGVSDYLHPLDATHVIGFGKDTVAGKNNAYYMGMKISLFDASNVNNPVEIAVEHIGDRGTESEMLNNHKALMVDNQRGIFAFPITIATAEKNNKFDVNGIPNYGEQTFQGAYVYNISVQDGIKKKGSITHFEKFNPYYYVTDNEIHRVIYIGNTLYSVSNNIIMATNLNSMKTLGKISIE